MEINKSCVYILPLYCKYFYNENNELEEILFSTFLLNCYCFKEKNNEKYKEFIIQLKKPNEKNEIFQKFLSNLKKSSIFVETYLKENSYYLCFEIPKEFQDVYDKFLNGKFSEFDKKHKVSILNFTKKNISIDFSIEIHQIFSKNKNRRKMLEEKLNMLISEDIELSSKPNLNQELIILNNV